MSLLSVKLICLEDHEDFVINRVEEEEEEESAIESQRSLTVDQKVELNKIIKEFESLGNIPLGRTNVISHDIDTGDNRPCFSHRHDTSVVKKRKIVSEFLRVRCR